MFDDSGDKIRTLATILFILSAVASVILAFVFGFEEAGRYYDRYTRFHPVPFFSFLIGGPLVSYIQSLFLAAFGDLVDHAQHTRFYTEELYRAAQKEKAETEVE